MATKINSSAQLDFIQRIKEVIPKSYSLVDELADLLQVSNDSAYRRIRGETSFTIDEIVSICNRYKISFDSFSNNNTGSVSFNYRPLGNDENSFLSYFKSLRNDLKKIESFEDKHIVFAAEDIPIFHYFNFPELTSFKIFYWNKSILNIPSLDKKKFDPSWPSKELQEIVKDILDLYMKIPSTEIWTDETVNSTLKQIEFYWESGIFQKKEDALTVCHNLEQMITSLQKQAELSTKFISESQRAKYENNFSLYNCEVTVGNNCILATMGDLKLTYISHHTLNTISTANSNFCEETDLWLKNLIKKSVLISGVSEKQRYQFFSKIQANVDSLKAKIK